MIDRRTANLNDAKQLRAHAKTIVDELFRISAKAGYEIPRSITYEVTISADDDN